MTPLRLDIELARGRQAGDRFAFRWGESEYVRIRGEDRVQHASLVWDEALANDLKAWQRGGLDVGARARIGAALRRLLLEAGWAEEEAAIARACQEGRRVFISLRLHAAELFALPWEALPWGDDHRPLGLEPGVLLRFASPGAGTTPPAQVPRHEGGRLLFAWSAAAGAVPAGQHAGVLGRCASPHVPWERADVLNDCTLPGIVARLNEAERAGRPYTILHLLAHGAALPDQSAGLALREDDELGDKVVVSGATLAAALAPFAPTLRLVVLCACYGGAPGPLGSTVSGVATAIHEAGLEAVIASRLPLSVTGSIALTEILYTRLLQAPDSVETAFEAAQESNATGTYASDGFAIQLDTRRADGDDTRPVVFRPYRGLLPFRQEDRRLFFGRETVVAEVVAKLEALVGTPELPDLLFLVGPSGVGKSSLLAAGVLPALEERWPGLHVASMRPGATPMEALEEAVAAFVPGPRLLLLDQLEELFTHGASAEQLATFAARLWEVLQSGVRCLAAIRGDYLANR